MYVMILAWDLRNSEQTVESLRDYLRDYAVEAFSEVEGMHLKVWFSNPERQVWGAVYLWDSAEAIANNRPPAPSRSIELIGYPPTSESIFEVEAVTAAGEAWQTFAEMGRAMNG